MAGNFTASRRGSGDRGFHLHAHTVGRDHRRLPRRMGRDRPRGPAARRVQGRRCRHVDARGVEQTNAGKRCHDVPRSGQHVGRRMSPELARCGGDRRRPSDGRNTDRRNDANHRGLGHRVPAVRRPSHGPSDPARWRRRHSSNGSARSSRIEVARESICSRTGPPRPIPSIWCERPGAARRDISSWRAASRQPTQIEDLKSAGADAFTVGSAVFDGSYSPNKGSIVSQLRDVMDAAGLP